VIAKSDLIILVLASSALAVGILRWHKNTQDVSAITIPASANSHVTGSRVAASRVIVEPAQNSTTATVQTAELVDNSANATSQSNSTNQIETKTLPQPIPVVEVVVASDATQAPNLGTHLVQSGDYLGKIANQYNTDVQTLRKLNNISGSVIQIGQEILYPQ